MANITWLGADYTGVDKVYLPETGTGNEITFYLNGGGASATQHSIHFEFTDGTDMDIDVFYDDTFIRDAILATTPTYGQKTVDSASLDGVTWYERPTETWEVIYNNNVGFFPEDNPTYYPYCWISSLGDVAIPTDSVWRVTFDGVTYRLVGKYDQSMDSGYIGNPKYSNSHPDDGSGVPFYFWQTPWGAWSGGADVENNSNHAVVIERLVT